MALHSWNNSETTPECKCRCNVSAHSFRNNLRVRVFILALTVIRPWTYFLESPLFMSLRKHNITSDNTDFTFSILLAWPFPRKPSVLGQFSSQPPMPDPSRKDIKFFKSEHRAQKSAKTISSQSLSRIENPSAHGRLGQQSWTSAPESVFSCGSGGGNTVFWPP